MKAITVVPGKAGAELDDVPDAQLQGLIKVRTIYTGICGTDREIVSGRLSIARPEKGERLILGHEAIGIVESAVPETGFSEGQIVVPIVRRPGNCVNCRNGRQDYCLDGNFVEAGIRGKDGFMREYFYEEPKFLVKVNDKANAEVCVITEPTKNIMKILEAVTIVSKRSLWGLSGGLNGKGVWIFGTGAEGLISAAVFKNAGAKVVLVNRRDPMEIEQTVIGRTGSKFFNSSNNDWKSFADTNPMDMMIDTVGVPKILEDSIPHLNRNGIIVLFGTGGQGISSPLEGGAIIRLVDKNATVVGCEDGAYEHYVLASEFIEKNHNRYGLDSIITGHYDKDHLEVLSNKGSDEIKSVIDWSKE